MSYTVTFQGWWWVILRSGTDIGEWTVFVLHMTDHTYRDADIKMVLT